MSAERALGLFHERAIQAVFTPWDTVTDAFNTYYGGTHFLVPAVVLAWLLLFGRLVVYATVLNVVRYEQHEGTVRAVVDAPPVPGARPVASRSGRLVTAD